MNDKTTSVEEKIILAAIESIEKYGIAGTTNRQIARIAGVNNAAINYYFRSKDVLIQRCMEITLKNAFDLSEIAPMSGLSAQERCIAILDDLIQGGLNYPGITRAHFYAILVEGQPDPLLEDRLNRFVEELADDLLGRGCELAPRELKLSLIQIVSAVILEILAPRLFERQHGLDLRNPDTRMEYVTRLVTRLLATAE